MIFKKRLCPFCSCVVEKRKDCFFCENCDKIISKDFYKSCGEK